MVVRGRCPRTNTAMRAKKNGFNHFGVVAKIKIRNHYDFNLPVNIIFGLLK